VPAFICFLTRPLLVAANAPHHDRHIRFSPLCQLDRLARFSAVSSHSMRWRLKIDYRALAASTRSSHSLSAGYHGFERQEVVTWPAFSPQCRWHYRPTGISSRRPACMATGDRQSNTMVSCSHLRFGASTGSYNRDDR
jgi:hypothetical protein